MLLLAIELPRKESRTSSTRNRQDLLFFHIVIIPNLLGGGETVAVITGLETVVIGGSVVGIVITLTLMAQCLLIVVKSAS
jgi:hypothetical protein